MTPLQTAAQAVISRWDSPLWKDQPHTGVYIEELRKALDAELAQSVEPVAVFHGLVDSGEHGAFNLDIIKMIPRGAYLYLHPQTSAVEARHGINAPADKPTGWDNGLSQDYCAEFGQWLASRPGARQQIKAMFDTSTPLQP